MSVLMMARRVSVTPRVTFPKDRLRWIHRRIMVCHKSVISVQLMTVFNGLLCFFSPLRLSSLQVDVIFCEVLLEKKKKKKQCFVRVRQTLLSNADTLNPVHLAAE